MEERRRQDAMLQPTPVPDRVEAERHIEALAGSKDSPVTFQAIFDDKTQSKAAHWFHGSLSQQWDNLRKLNDAGYGIFIMVNEGDLKGRSAGNVTALRALFIDDDHGTVNYSGEPNEKFTTVLPTLTVQSKAGQHNYFRLRTGEVLDRFKAAQKTLARHFGTDTSINDLPRIMRLAGFVHRKDAAAPFMVRVVHTGPAEYSIDDVLRAYPAPMEEALPSAKTREGAVARRPADYPERAKKFAATQPVAVQGEAGDRRTFAVCCKVVRGFDLTDEEATEALEEWNSRCSPPWDRSDLLQKIQNARRYGKEAFGGRLAQNVVDEPESLYSDELTFVVGHDKYYMRGRLGEWMLETPISKAAARMHLYTVGYSPDEAGSILARGRHPIAHGVLFDPSRAPAIKDGDKTYLNCLRPSFIVPKPGRYPRIEKMLDKVTGFDPLGREWLVNWMAFKVQNPCSLSMTAVVLQGSNGTGKSRLGVILGQIIGMGNVASIGQQDIESNFNGVFATKLLVLADEVVNSDNARDTASALKKYIADEMVTVNVKNVANYSFKNCMSWWFTSNSPTPVRLDGEADRRYTVFNEPTPPAEEYKAMFRTMFTPTDYTPDFQEEVDAFAFDLSTMKVDVVRAQTVYKNKARAELIELTRSSSEAFCDEVRDSGIVQVVKDYWGPHVILEKEEWDFGERGVYVHAVYEAYRHFCQERGIAKPVGMAAFVRDVKRFLLGTSTGKLGKADRKGRRGQVFLGLPRESATSETADGGHPHGPARHLKAA